MNRKQRGFLTDGKDIFIRRVNDIIANKYRVMKITAEIVNWLFESRSNKHHSFSRAARWIEHEERANEGMADTFGTDTGIRGCSAQRHTTGAEQKHGDWDQAVGQYIVALNRTLTTPSTVLHLSGSS
jgi:hypothetical protein